MCCFQVRNLNVVLKSYFGEGYQCRMSILNKTKRENKTSVDCRNVQKIEVIVKYIRERNERGEMVAINLI